MPFDPLEYSQMLDQALAPARGGATTVPALGQPAPRSMPDTRVQAPPLDAGGGMGDLGGRAPPLDQRAPQPVDGTAAPTAQGAPNAPGGQKIEALPPFKVQYKKGALDGAKTINDVVDAMKPASQTKYMDWWESKYGSIQDKYSQMQQELGKRPEPDRDMTKKEQFRMLMEFGMHLMRAGGQGDPAPGSTALTNAYAGAKGRQQQETADYDQRSSLIAKGRADELKGIGDFGDALKVQSDIDQNDVQMQEARGRMKKAENEAPDVQYGDDGMMQWNPGSKSYEALTIDGKRQTNLKVGARGASAASRDSRTANQKNISDLVDRGVPEQLALDIVYRRVTDPRKAWENIYRDRRRQYASEEDARREADEIMEQFYGNDWKDRPTNAEMKDTADPLGLR